jgi:DNA invertase Pin-like site-specific DNA recombinase
MKANTAKKRSSVAYLRVSTREQGTSGLGLEAQRRAVDVFCESHGYQVTVTYQDVESGKHNARPGLAAALAAAKVTGATLIIAKLDRLSRNAAFIMTLRDSGVDFIAADMPEANTLTVGIMALLAQQERELISTRTLAALAELKARGVRLGSPEHLTDEARAKGRAARSAVARLHANGAFTHAVAYRAAGWTLAKISEQLNQAGARTRRGKLFTPTSVLRLLRIAKETKGATT